MPGALVAVVVVVLALFVADDGSDLLPARNPWETLWDSA